MMAVTEEAVRLAYVFGFARAVNGEPKSTSKYRKAKTLMAYREGFASGEHHLRQAQERAKHYAAQLCHGQAS